MLASPNINDCLAISQRGLGGWILGGNTYTTLSRSDFPLVLNEAGYLSIYAVLFTTSMQDICLVADENETCGEITYIYAVGKHSSLRKWYAIRAK